MTYFWPNNWQSILNILERLRYEDSSLFYLNLGKIVYPISRNLETNSIPFESINMRIISGIRKWLFHSLVTTGGRGNFLVQFRNLKLFLVIQNHWQLTLISIFYESKRNACRYCHLGAFFHNTHAKLTQLMSISSTSKRVWKFLIQIQLTKFDQKWQGDKSALLHAN